jgi:hypothetical protein
MPNKQSGGPDGMQTGHRVSLMYETRRHARFFRGIPFQGGLRFAGGRARERPLDSKCAESTQRILRADQAIRFLIPGTAHVEEKMGKTFVSRSTVVDHNPQIGKLQNDKRPHIQSLPSRQRRVEAKGFHAHLD